MPRRERTLVDDRPKILNRFESPSQMRDLRLRYVSVGAKAIGALAIGAIAIGALAIGAVAISRLAIGRARIRHVEVDELVVRRLRITEEVRGPDKPEAEK